MSNSVMTFLKKAGSDILATGKKIAGYAPLTNTIGAVVEAVDPGAAPLVNIVESDIAKMLGVVTTVEAIGQSVQLSGSQKLAVAIPGIGQVISQVSALAGKTIANQALYATSMQEFAQATVDLANSLAASTTPTPTPVPNASVTV